MLDSKGFDLWSDGYDRSVNLSEEADEYPFAGYKALLAAIYRTIRRGEGVRVLDVGCGTGVLMKKLYDSGYAVTGMDFSQKMLAIAREKMPDAALIQHDFSHGLPQAVVGQSFDFIVCTYAIHHLDLGRKIAFIRQMRDALSPHGKLLVGDVAFATAGELAQCRRRAGDDWDEDELYPVLEELKPHFPTMAFEQISFCAGILSLDKETAQ